MAGLTRMSRSWVLKHPCPRRVIEFYGGEAIGVTPHLSYGALFDYLYARENTVIAMPVPIGPDHATIAQFVLEERRVILNWLGYDPDSQPSCMVGHSIGGQMIALLASLTDTETKKFMVRGHEQSTGLMGTPMLFMAPFIGDFDNPNWAGKLLNALGLGFKPPMADIIAMFNSEQADLFARAGLLAFDKDKDAGTLEDCPDPTQPPCKKSVPWFRYFLQKMDRPCYEIPGDHLTPMGTWIGDRVYRPSINYFSQQFPRPVDKTVFDMLELLDPGGAKLAAAKAAMAMAHA